MNSNNAHTPSTIIPAASATRTIELDEYVYPSPAVVAVSWNAERVTVVVNSSVDSDMVDEAAEVMDVAAESDAAETLEAALALALAPVLVELISRI